MATRMFGGKAIGANPALLHALGVVGLSLLSLGVAYSLSKTSAFLVVGGLAGFAVLCASFMSPKFGVALLIMSMLLSPEFGGGGGGGGDTGRAIVIRMDDVLLVILSVAWFARTAVHKDLGFVLRSSLNRPIAFYTLSCIISTLLGYMAGSIRGMSGAFFVIRYFEYFVVFFLALNFITSLDVMKRFLKLAFFTAICISIYGMTQIPLGVRVSAPFEGDSGEPNTLGGYLILLMCMAGGQMIFARGLKALAGWGGLIFMMFVPLLFTGSRASWLALPVCVLMFCILGHKKKQIATFALFAVFGTVLLLPATVKERLLFTFKQEKQLKAKQIEVGAVRLDSSTSARLESYGQAIDGWMQKPILGWGVTGFIFVDSQPVRTLVETGLVGMVAFLWLVWGYLQAGRAAMRASTDQFQRGIAIGYLAALFGLLAHSSGSNTFIILRVMEPWMLFTAMVIRIPALAEERNRQWEEMEREEGQPLPQAAAPEPEEEKTKEGEGDSGESRFEKKLSGHEEFLERERVEMARREIEARRKETEKPKFRKELATSARDMEQAAFAKRAAAGSAALAGSKPANSGAAGSAAPAGSFPKRPRNVDLAREAPARPFSRRSG
ncbi:MAG: O-antigen ligase family protein [Nitrospinota bacterium]